MAGVPCVFVYQMLEKKVYNVGDVNTSEGKGTKGEHLLLAFEPQNLN
jgi:hypothetical protein